MSESSVVASLVEKFDRDHSDYWDYTSCDSPKNSRAAFELADAAWDKGNVVLYDKLMEIGEQLEEAEESRSWKEVH
jgi:hypothetical protein